MKIKIGVVMDPIKNINPKKDTTIGILLESQRRHWDIEYIPVNSIFTQAGEIYARSHALTLTDTSTKLTDLPATWYELSTTRNTNLSTLNIILIRQDPPVDTAYLYCTYLLEPLINKGVLLINHPQSIRDANEKLFALQFQHCVPAYCVTSLFSPLANFYNTHQDIIIKPLDGMGGTGIFRVKPGDQNLKVIHEVLSEQSTRPIMAQKYIPEIVDGDKRILIIDGTPFDYALARVPPKGELRGNLAAGGTGVGVTLSKRDRWICEQVGPTLKKLGLIFVGLDIIGDFLTEINVTSPTCMRELEDLYDTNIASKLLDVISAKL